LLTGIQDNAVQPVACQTLAMREDDKAFMTSSALFADFICHLKQNPSNVHFFAKLSSSGRGSRKGCDTGGSGGGRHGCSGRGSHGSASKGSLPDQSEVDKVTWLHANKYYTAKEYAKFTAAKKVWVHQNRCVPKSPATKRKVAAVTGDADNTTVESEDNRGLFGDQDDTSVSSKHST
jgi:hypothetical protein